MSVQMDDSTLKDNEDVFIACVGYVDEYNFEEVMLLLFDVNNIPMKIIKSCAASFPRKMFS